MLNFSILDTKNVQGQRKKKEEKRIGSLDIEDNKLDKGIVISFLIIHYTYHLYSHWLRVYN